MKSNDMKNSQIKRLNGFIRLDRKIIFLLSDRILTQEEFLIYLLSIFLTDWSIDHDAYGSVCALNREIAQLLGWKSRSSVTKHKKNLIAKGYLELLPDKRTIAKKLSTWARINKYTSIQDNEQVVKNSEHDVVNIQQAGEKNEQNQSQIPKSSLSSFKVNSSLRTEEEYQRIWKEDYDCSPDFTPDDMKWIDQNVYEDPSVPS